MLTRWPDKFYRHLTWGLFAVLGLLVLLTFRRYGITWDEEIQSQYGQAVYDYYASLFLDQRYKEIFNLYLYGGMFDGLAAFVNAYTPLTVYETRHLLNAVLGLVGLWGTWRLGRLLVGGFVGFAATALLALVPSYYGHMFNNPKDIPFAAGIVWSLYFMAKTFLAYPGVRYSLALKLALVYGLTLGVRVNGIMTIGFWGLVLMGLAFWQLPRPWRGKEIRATLVSLLKIGVPVTALSYIVMLACWPWAQEAPVANPLAAIREFSNFPQVVEVLLDGTTYLSTELPWFYVPLYFAVQLPLLHLVLIFLGLLGLPLLAWRSLPSAGKKATLALLLLTAGFPVFYAMLSHPALYDTVRHFTFVFPPLCIVAALALKAGLLWLNHALKSCELRPVRRAVWGLVALGLGLGVSGPLAAMIDLHPYEYIYVNGLAGGVRGAYGRYELDYWGTSFKEAAQRLQAFVAKEGGVPDGRIYKIAICGPWSAAMIYLPPDYEAVEANEPADFFMATSRWKCQDMRGGKEILRIERDGVPLSVVKDLRGTEEGALGMPNYREEQREKEEKEREDNE